MIIAQYSGLLGLTQSFYSCGRGHAVPAGISVGIRCQCFAGQNTGVTQGECS